MTWLYQPLPLASTLTSGADASEALSGEVSTSGVGGCAVDHSQLLAGDSSTGGSGSFNIELLVTSLITGAQTSPSAANNTVRLRSRKTGGASGTADKELTTQVSDVFAGTMAKTVSVLLGGTGVTCSAQTIPAKTTAVLMQGITRTMSPGNVIGTQDGQGFIPSWVQLPTQVDEQNYYDTNFGANTGKDTEWAWISNDKSPSASTGFSVTAPVSVGTYGYNISSLPNPQNEDGLHDDSEADDLWNHYMQYKRTGESRYLSWAQAWRDYFVSDADWGYLDDLTNEGFTFDHLYGQGLVMWGMEQNDPAARNRALDIAALVEASALALTPGVSNLSSGESRRWARRLLFYCYITMMEPTTRWITVRDHLIDCWVQSTGWQDTGNSNIVIGGNHFAGRINILSSGGPGSIPLYDLGHRWDAAWHYGLKNEAFWLAYKLTGRTDVRDMLIQMARFTLYYAWDPTHVNAMHGSRWGVRADGSHWHFHQDDWDSSGNAVPDTIWTDPTRAPTDNYETSNINGLVRAYKLTGELPFLVRAREHLRQATCYGAATGHQTKLNEAEVHFYADTQRNNPSSGGYLFNYNKGMLQYCSALFENGGSPTLEPSATWIPPYPIPTTDGQVVRIAGDATSTLASTYHSGGSAWPTNCYTDVAATESNGSFWDTKNWIGCDTGSTFIESYSLGGAMVTAGGGGHHGGFNHGAMLFDFEDGRWKRIWTHSGNPGVDNVAGVPADGRAVGPDPQDRRSGTTIHNVPFFLATTGNDLVGRYAHTSNTAVCDLPTNSPCWNPTHWAPSAADLAKVPLAADPTDQYWEITISYGKATAYTPADFGTEHNFPYPESEWNGFQNGRFDAPGYMTDNVRFTPTPAGTLAPTQSELPGPSHIWQNFGEMLPEDGGGTKGSIICLRHLYAAEAGDISLPRSHRFDLETGIWHVYSSNDIGEGEGTAAGGGESWNMEGQTASAYDSVTKRFYGVGQRITKTTSRINYMNAEDRTWRNLLVGSGGVVPQGRCEGLMVDPDRRLLLVCAELTHASAVTAGGFYVIDLKTVTGTIPTTASGGWKLVPLTNVPGVQTHNNNATFLFPWRYYPPNGKYYRIYPRTTPGGSPSSPWPAPPITVLQRLTPPAIVDNDTRANFYYTTGANWTYDEITLNSEIPAPTPESAYQSAGHNTFLHYVPSLECFAWFPLDRATNGGVQTRRSVFLIKPF